MSEFKTVYVIARSVSPAGGLSFIRAEIDHGHATASMDFNQAATFATTEHATHFRDEMLLSPDTWMVMPWVIPE